MKKLNLSIRSLFVLCLAAVSVAANAQQVSQEEAANIALQFLKGNGSQNSRLKKATPEALKLVYTEPSAKDKSANLYIYNMEGGGFAIVSADARTGSQILGYSFDNNFSAKGMPDNVKYWLGEYSRQIDFIKAHQPEVSESKRREGLKKDSGPIPASPTVAPLLSTTWGQDNPYNGMTPMLEGQHTRTGCVATAMAQIINYHKWPVTGIGAHSYYWTAGKEWPTTKFYDHTYAWVGKEGIDEPMTNSYDDTSYSDQNPSMVAVAQLMYDCGVAVDMDYGLKASGAYDEKVIPALTSHFGYSHTMSLEYQSDYNDADWIELLIKELKANRPVYYSANDETPNDSDGHAFVVDGYGTIDDETYFHINWGWDGYDGFGNQDTDISNDGYFAMNAFNTEYHNTGEIDYYNLNSLAIINIIPDANRINEINLIKNTDILDNLTWSEDVEELGNYYWTDKYMYNNHPSESNLLVRTNNDPDYSHIKKVELTDWQKSVVGNMYVTKESEVVLYFYWNTETNDCYLPSQYSGYETSQEATYKYLWYVKFDGFDNADDRSYDIVKYNSQNETNFGHYDSRNETFSLNFFQIQGENSTTAPKYRSGNRPAYTTATLSKYKTPESEGFFLGDFIEDDDMEHPSATQIVYMEGVPEYELKLVPVEDILGDGKSTATRDSNVGDLIAYYNGFDPVNDVVDDDKIEAYFGDYASFETNKGAVKYTNVPSVDLKINNEGAYYVIVVYPDDSYEYMPVYFSSSKRWEKLGHAAFKEVLLFKGYIFDDYDDSNIENYWQPYNVDVEEYKVRENGTRIYRIKNPYYIDNRDGFNSPFTIAALHEIPVGSTTDIIDNLRKDVYIYFCSNNNSVSLFPSVFNRQPTGISVGNDELMISAEVSGEANSSNNENNEILTISFSAGNMALYDNSTPEDGYYTDWSVDGDLYLTLSFGSLIDAVPYSRDAEQYNNREVYARNITSQYGTLMMPFDFKASDVRFHYLKYKDGQQEETEYEIPTEYDYSLDATFNLYKLAGIKDGTDNTLVFTSIPKNDVIPANTPVVFKYRDDAPHEIWGDLYVYKTDVTVKPNSKKGQSKYDSDSYYVDEYNHVLIKNTDTNVGEQHGDYYYLPLLEYKNADGTFSEFDEYTFGSKYPASGRYTVKPKIGASTYTIYITYINGILTAYKFSGTQTTLYTTQTVRVKEYVPEMTSESQFTTNTEGGLWTTIGTYSPIAVYEKNEGTYNQDYEIGDTYTYKGVDYTIYDVETDPYYFLSGDQMKQVSNVIRVKPYRGMFKSNGASSAKLFYAVFDDDDEVVSIESILNPDNAPKESRRSMGRRNLAGQAVGEDYKGVIIENGIKKLRY